MRVYLIRHGETVPNTRHIHQPADTDLSARGKRQAKRVAKALTDRGIDYMITSDMPRATQTADIISDTIGVQYVKSGLLREIRRPTSLYNRSHYNPLSVWYVLSMILHRNRAGWHFRDGENIHEVNTRASELLRKLATLLSEYKSIAVISHAVFISNLVSFLGKNDESYTAFDYFPIFSPISKIPNGAITTIEYIPSTANWANKWYVLERNNTVHLA